MRNFLLLLSLALIGIAGCNAIPANSYPTGYNTPAAGTAPNSNKTFAITGLTSCGPLSTCNAVYTTGSIGSGIAASDGTNSIKIYSANNSTYTIVRTGAGACSGAFDGTFGVGAAPYPQPTADVNGLFTVTITVAGTGCAAGVTGSITAQSY